MDRWTVEGGRKGGREGGMGAGRKGKREVEREPSVIVVTSANVKQKLPHLFLCAPFPPTAAKSSFQQQCAREMD